MTEPTVQEIITGIILEYSTENPSGNLEIVPTELETLTSDITELIHQAQATPMDIPEAKTIR